MALFIVYVAAFCICWYFGASKRELLKREAVEKQIEKEKAQQALNNLE